MSIDMGFNYWKAWIKKNEPELAEQLGMYPPDILVAAKALWNSCDNNKSKVLAVIEATAFTRGNLL